MSGWRWAVWLILTGIADAVLILWDPSQKVPAWLATIAGMTLMIVDLGISVRGRPDGIIIDNRNRISLSKFQMTAWTVIVLSAFIVTVAFNLLARGYQTALDFTVDKQLWALMGISTVSFLGAPMILGQKAGKTADRAQLALTQSKLDGTVDAQGHVLINRDIKDASWLELFRGDEVGNGATLDLSKVQNFLITIVTLAMYAVALGTMFHNAKLPDGIKTFPALSDGFIYLLLISHGGYLTYKSVSHSKDV